MTSSEVIARGRYDVDPGSVELGGVDDQTRIDEAGCANLLFTVPGVAPGRQDLGPSIDLGDLWWVEPVSSATGELASLALLVTSFHIGRGALAGTLERVDGAEQGRVHWRVTIDSGSITAPPIHFADEGDPPTQASWKDDAVVAALHRRDDGAVVAIDLWQSTDPAV
ncbi:hypothetical protein [Microbacterium sp. TNHR37B]|uniref:hypothetical protein n=1 Tax=Microbacterium sp. TNHR37B TaxID=1775956 RepID=UPI0007B1C44C|nr:hypothetical protein [Microbacterium sp. TNHR37B]KZE90583.1 hypothetical protein AVP41_00102 [Microbacterium sp. TNHR37B]